MDICFKHYVPIYALLAFLVKKMAKLMPRSKYTDYFEKIPIASPNTDSCFAKLKA